MSISMHQLQLGDICIDVEQKDIKNIHLSVNPPCGRVRIAAPLRMNIITIRSFAITKLNWIKKQRKKFMNQDREAPREYVNRESHYYNGKRYLLTVVEIDAPPKVEIKHSELVLYVRPGTDSQKRHDILNEWYRVQLKSALPALIEKWEKIINVHVNEFRIKKMKTKWGSCNVEARRIWLNLELAKKPFYCLEYVLVHEMVHLLERKHNNKFIVFMDKYLPNWRVYKEELNRLPIKYDNPNSLTRSKKKIT